MRGSASSRCIERRYRPRRRATAIPAQGLLDPLWARTAAVAQAHSGQEATAPFVECVNHVVSLNTERVMVRERSRTPGALSVIVFLISVVSFAAGSDCGARYRRGRPTAPALFSCAASRFAVGTAWAKKRFSPGQR